MDSLALRLDEEQTLLEDAMTADRDEMAARLNEVYGYNSYDFDGADHGFVGTHVSAPYSHEQQRSFFYKLTYYINDSIAATEARLATKRNDY